MAQQLKKCLFHLKITNEHISKLRQFSYLICCDARPLLCNTTIIKHVLNNKISPKERPSARSAPRAGAPAA